jgi:hypothetical protein
MIIPALGDARTVGVTRTVAEANVLAMLRGMRCRAPGDAPPQVMYLCCMGCTRHVWLVGHQWWLML